MLLLFVGTRQRASKDIFASATDFDCWKRDIPGTNELRSKRKKARKTSRFHRQSPCLCVSDRAVGLCQVWLPYALDSRGRGGRHEKAAFVDCRVGL